MQFRQYNSSLVALALAASIQSAGVAAGAVAVSGDRPGAGNTLHAMAYDGRIESYFQPGYDNWQHVQIDFGCPVTFYGLRRYMSRDGKSNIAGHRGRQGEGVSVSRDGITWTNLTHSTSTGWSNTYVNYAPDAWHSVSYGWSLPLKPIQPLVVRYVRFNWDANADFLHEIDVSYDRQLCLDFEDLPANAQYGAGTFLVPSGVFVKVDPFRSGSGAFTANRTAVTTGAHAGGTGQELEVNNVNLRFDIPCQPVKYVTLRFGEFGGNLNLMVNGKDLNFKNFAEIDQKWIGQVHATVTGGSGQDRGTLTLSGEIHSFSIGGQELWIDDVCFRG